VIKSGSGFQVQRSGFAFRFGGIVAAVFLLLGLPTASWAQTAIEFFPAFDFHMDASMLGSDDPRFSWDANLGGALDVLGWNRGRATFLANYEVIMGDEFRRFDPNQGNYTLEGSVSRDLAGVEVSGQFHHVSRHLSDRPKRQAIDWNMIGARIRRSQASGAAQLDAQVDIRGVLAKSAVDYRWEVESAIGSRFGIRPRVDLVTGVSLRVLGVDGSLDRGTQAGFRGEGGVRLKGTGASMELFVAAERRIDPYQLQAATDTWLAVGFRLVGRDEVP